MPGYVIHLCVAKEYVKKHGIKNENKFYDGTVFPDTQGEKGETHYSRKGSAETDLCAFLQDKKLDTDFNLRLVSAFAG